MGHMLKTINPERADQLQREGDAGIAALEEGAAAMQGGESLDEGPGWPVAQPVSNGPLPDVGDWVIYRPRIGEIRRVRDRVPALVVWVDPEKRTCELAVVFNANDVVEQQNVPERVGDERGWELKGGVITSSGAMTAPDWTAESIGKLREEVAELRGIILGEYEKPMSPILAMLDDIDSRVDTVLSKDVALNRGGRAAALKRKPKGAKKRK